LEVRNFNVDITGHCLKWFFFQKSWEDDGVRESAGNVFIFME
jgi:hypothetical protein